MDTTRRPDARILTALLALATLGLSGCAGFTAEADLSFDGSGNGSHSDAADCDADGTVFGAGSITDGQVAVRVTDSEGNTLYSQVFDGDFDLSAQELTGHSGTWTLHATRGGDDLVGDPFRGDYELYLECTSGL